MRTLPIVRRIEVQLIVCLCVFCCPNLRAQTSVWTWHNDNGRTGQNASETSLTPTTVVKTSFGQVCHYAVDGQVYAQPLVLANATVLGTHRSSVVYVVTQNDSVYLLDGTNCGFIASAITGTSTSLIPSGETAVSCSNIGSTRCKTIAPTVGILGTPVIDENTNHIYVVTYSQSGSNYYHRLHALFTGLVSGTTPLAEDPAYNSSPNGVIISSGSTFSPQFISQTHIQRPGVLLLPDTQAARPQIYIGFSMMDGLPSFPPGFIFRYYGDDLSQTPLVYTSEPTSGKAGGGFWMDGAGLAGGIDSTGGNTYLYVTTADGDFDPLSSTLPCSDCGDSFVKLTAALGVSSSFTPADQACRFIDNPLTNPDLDFGSGGVMLIPDTLLTSWPYLAVSADKNQNIWVMQRLSPGFYNGGSTCTNGSNANLEIVAGTGMYHNTPAFWQSGTSRGYLYYSSIGGAISQYPVQSTCTSGTPPICNAINTSVDPAGATHTFSSGTTPAVSSNGTLNGIVWALDGASVEGTNNGALWAFRASNMQHLYNSTQCAGDAIHSATQFSVPTIANGYVYVGAQSDNSTGSSTKGQGTFYIFGLTTRTC